jgi:hypothetical protein
MEGILPGDNEHMREAMNRLRKQDPKVEVENPFETGLHISEVMNKPVKKPVKIPVDAIWGA